MIRTTLSVIGAAAVLGAPLGYRFGGVPVGPALLVLVGGVALSMIGFVLGLVSLIRGTSLGGAWGGVCLLMAATASLFPIWMVVSNAGKPAIHDITTDTDDPPTFEAVVRLRHGVPNTLDYGGAELAEAQKAAYPDLESVVVNATVDTVVARAQTVAEELGWEIVSTDATSGRVEASDTTFWFGFKDDVVVRVRPSGEGDARVDVRSVSRVGQGDLAANATRIRRFLANLHTGLQADLHTDLQAPDPH